LPSFPHLGKLGELSSEAVVKPFSVVIILSALASVSLGQTSVIPGFDRLRELYEKAQVRIEADYEATKSDALDGYGKALDRVLDHLKEKGDPDAYMLVNKEKKRFDRDGGVPKPSGKPQWKFVDAAVAKHARNLVTAEQAYHEQMAEMLSAYIPRLHALVKQLMQDDRIQDAKVVADEMARAESELVAHRSTLDERTSATGPQPQGVVTVTPDDKVVKTTVGKLEVGERLANNRSYTFDSVPDAVRGFNFVRMECKKNGDYAFQVRRTLQLFALVVTKWSDAKALERAGWRNTGLTLLTNIGDKVRLYGKHFGPGTYRVNSGKVYPYMLVTSSDMDIAHVDEPEGAKVVAKPQAKGRNARVKEDLARAWDDLHETGWTPDGPVPLVHRDLPEDKYITSGELGMGLPDDVFQELITLHRVRATKEAYLRHKAQSGMAAQFKDTESRHASLDKVLFEPEKYEGQALKSRVHLWGALSENTVGIRPLGFNEPQELNCLAQVASKADRILGIKGPEAIAEIEYVVKDRKILVTDITIP